MMTQQNNGNNRGLSVFAVTEYEDKNGQGTKSSWTKIGVAWMNRDGSMNLKLDAFPVNGKLHVRESNDRKEGERPRHSSGPREFLPQGGN
jgi:hypothetical protein